MTYKTDLTKEELDELLRYEEDDGRFYWNTSGRGRATNKPAGYLCSDGYRAICINGSLYKEHRLVWLHTTGSWPNEQLDHIDGNRSHNKFENLRDVNASVNQHNLRGAHKDAAVPSLGVTFHHGKFYARLVVQGVTHNLGYYATEEEAARVYRENKEAMCDRDYQQVNAPVVIDL